MTIFFIGCTIVVLLARVSNLEGSWKHENNVPLNLTYRKSYGPAPGIVSRSTYNDSQNHIIVIKAVLFNITVIKKNSVTAGSSTTIAKTSYFYRTLAKQLYPPETNKNTILLFKTSYFCLANNNHKALSL